MSRVSIKNIAQALGISNATVSLVLNSKEKEGRIGKVMADRIRQTAKEMNYEPNNLARSLRMGHSHSIGLIVADISNLFFASLAFHIQEQAEKYGYSVIITNTNESDSKMEKMIQILKGRQVDGFILVPTEHGEKSVEYLVKSSTPVVLLDRYFPHLNASHVIVDNYQASFNATKHLISLGCKKIGLIIYGNILPHMQDRKRGYEDSLKQTDLYNSTLVKEITYSSINNEVERAIDDFLGKEIQVDGIFFATNSIAITGIKCILKKQKHVFEKLRIVSFDKSDAFDISNVPISYVQQPIEEMGKTAVDILISQIKKDSENPIQKELTTSLKIKNQQDILTI